METVYAAGMATGNHSAGISCSDGDGPRRAVEAFVLAFDSNLKPVVGQQITIGRRASAAELARASLLVARAEAGDCDLVAKGSSPVGERGYLYTGGGRYLSDKRQDGSLTQSALRARHDSLTFTCVPPGSGQRIGIDRDRDGILDGDEIR